MTAIAPTPGYGQAARSCSRPVTFRRLTTVTFEGIVIGDGQPVWATVQQREFRLPQTPAASANDDVEGTGTMMDRKLSSRPTKSVDTSWRDQASCRFANLDLFFPADSTGISVEDIDAAKAICRACQVQDRCLRFALETNQEVGIWGGTTEAERRKLRRAWLVTRRASEMNA